MAGKVAILMLALVTLVAATQANAQTHRKHAAPKDAAQPAAAIPVDKRDSVIAAAGPFNGRPYWLALSECGGIYFRLNALYTDVAVHARVGRPEPQVNAEYTRKLNEAMRTATTFFDGAEHFLMTDRGLDRVDAVLVYNGPSQAAGDRIKTIEAGLSAVTACPALYHSCQEAFAKACGVPLTPSS
jgi:hypothetical protein